MFDSMLFGYHQMPYGRAIDSVYGLGMGTVIEVRLPIRQPVRFFPFSF